MINNIKFYHSVAELPATIEGGVIYFVLQENNIASLKVDLNNNRYTVTPVIPETTSKNSGLMIAENKKKLIPYYC